MKLREGFFAHLGETADNSERSTRPQRSPLGLRLNFSFQNGCTHSPGLLGMAESTQKIFIACGAREKMFLSSQAPPHSRVVEEAPAKGRRRRHDGGRKAVGVEVGASSPKRFLRRVAVRRLYLGADGVCVYLL